MRDYLPAEAIARQRVMDTVRKVYERYGFYPIDTPVLENIDILNAKCGEEVSKQIFTVDNSEFGLRFDQTVPLARVVAGNGSIVKPFKRYSIAKAWRREEPQKGRLREFYQADVDIVGSASMKCEAELYAAAADALAALGFRSVEIHLSNRKILSAALQKCGVKEKDEGTVSRSLDKLDKIGEAGVKKELGEKKISEECVSKVLELGAIKGTNEQKLAAVSKIVAGSATGEEGVKELLQILAYFSNYEISRTCSIVIDFGIIRGFNYYTGPVCEMVVPNSGFGSIAGGGRFDQLIGNYGAQPLPATGLALGIERIIAILREKNTFEEGALTSRVFVAPVKPEFYNYGIKVLQQFRSAGVNSEIDIMDRALRKQFEYAAAVKIPFVAIVGEKEMKEGKVTLRNLADGNETMVLPKEAAEIVLAAEKTTGPR